MVVGSRCPCRYGRARRRLRDRRHPVPAAALAGRLLRRRVRAPARRPDHARRHARAPSVAADALAPERRARGMGAASVRARTHRRDGRPARARPGCAGRHPPTRGAAGLASDVLRLASPLGLRRRARPPVDDPPPRARHIHGRRPPLVAGRPRAPVHRRQVAVRLRRVRPRQPTRAPPRAPPASGLPLLRADAGTCGASPTSPTSSSPG